MLGLRIALVAALFVAWTAAAAGEGFLAHGRSVTAAVVEDVLLTEIHSEANKVHIGELQAALRVTYAVLPKNEHGRLDPSTVRYALHRYFVHTFGWYVKGLEPDGFVWASTSTEIMKDRVPAHIMSLLEKRMQGIGLDLEGLAIFAATLTELIEKEITSQFEESYAALGFSTTGTVQAHEVDEVMRGYLARFLVGGLDPVLNQTDLMTIEEEIALMFAGWPETKMWLKDTRMALDWSQESRRNPFAKDLRTLDNALGTARDIMHQFSHITNFECTALKSSLLHLDFQGTGRIRLVDWYANSQGQLRESEEYLRNLGCIDQSDPTRPMLLIANYISSRANCLVDTSYYSTCCLNECEGLMAHIEDSVMAPDAEPGRIADIVSRLPSNTVHAPRNLSVTLLRRLSGIADRHDGRVPLHGRLFSQWMHHVYPRECPYPHLSGSFKQFTQDEWIHLKGVDNVIATSEEIEQHLKSMSMWKREDVPTTADEFAWSTQEELVAAHWRPAPRMSDWKNYLRLLMCGVALTSMVMPLTRSLQNCKSASRISKTDHHCV